MPVRHRGVVAQLQVFFVLVVARLFEWFQENAVDFLSAFAVHNNFIYTDDALLPLALRARRGHGI
jgi:hypothetical protein